MLQNAHRDMSAAVAATYHLEECCGGTSRSCLPWVLERSWQPIFHLAELSRRHASEATAAATGLGSLLQGHVEEWHALVGSADLLGKDRRSRAWQARAVTLRCVVTTRHVTPLFTLAAGGVAGEGIARTANRDARRLVTSQGVCWRHRVRRGHG